MNQPATSGRKPTTPSWARDACAAVSAAYRSAPPRAAALATAAGIDTRLGRREAARYDPIPSTMPNGSTELPAAMTIALAAVTAASTGSGQRRSSGARAKLFLATAPTVISGRAQHIVLEVEILHVRRERHHRRSGK